MNNLAMLSAMAFEPRRAWQELGKTPRVWFPLLLLLVAAAGLLFWYYQVIDLRWMLESTLRANPRTRQMSEVQITQAAQAVSPQVMVWSSVIGGALIILILRLLEALYYSLAGKITNVQRTYKHWLSLACWSSFPQVLAIIPSMIVLLTASTNQLDQNALQPLSLNALFFHRTMAERGFQMLTSINLLHVWSLFLPILGVKVWSGRSWLFSTVFALLPWALFVGIWALFALR
jgi:Yip1 domain